MKAVPVKLLFLFAVFPFTPTLGWLSKTGTTHTAASRRRSSFRLLDSPNDNEADRLRLRMQWVRSLQTTFYTNTTTSTLLQYDMLYDLPLWKVSWTELPGRTNILNIHDPRYTNLFERILHSQTPWYVGHLYDGNENDSSALIRTWNEVINEGIVSSSSSSPLGTLMRIVDYRRMDDGRLLLLVQGLERLVVTEIVQTKPYALGHVHILPDVEEIDDSDWMHHRTEHEVAPARALAVAESFHKWHRYEYEHTVLPLPLREDLKADQVVGSALAQVLPWAPYSAVVQAECLLRQEPPLNNATRRLSSTCCLEDAASPTLEHCLWQKSILRHPFLDPTWMLKNNSDDELEIQVWLALNSFLQISKKPVSPILLGFLPHGVEWPEQFVLERITMAIDESDFTSKYVRLSTSYPAGRRRKRLSYVLSALLEQHPPNQVHRLRQDLLAIPSTRIRLVYVLQLLHDQTLAFQ